MLASTPSRQLQSKETGHKSELSVREDHEPVVQTHVQGIREGQFWSQAVLAVTTAFLSAYSAKGKQYGREPLHPCLSASPSRLSS